MSKRRRVNPESYDPTDIGRQYIDKNPPAYDAVALKEEMRQLEKTMSNTNELLYQQNQLLQQLLDKMNAAVALGSIAKSFIKGR